MNIDKALERHQPHTEVDRYCTTCDTTWPCDAAEALRITKAYEDAQAKGYLHWLEDCPANKLRGLLAAVAAVRKELLASDNRPPDGETVAREVLALLSEKGGA